MDETTSDRLLTRWRELGDVLQRPDGQQDAKQAVALSMSIAREAPNTVIRALAMKLIAEFEAVRRSDPSKRDSSSLYVVLEQLRRAIEEPSETPGP